ncbi:MAG: hypothetical protein NTV77_00585 [Candidatus Azambacteria bacterium]|nr:hypothetical protein [Candidatus Azambacteria bacterium]
MTLPILSAILGILAFLPVNFYWIGFFFLVPLFIFFIREKKFWRLIIGASVFKLIFALGTVYFTLEPITWLFSILIFLGLPVSVFIVKKFSQRLPAANYILIFTLSLLWTFFDHLEARYSLLPTYIITAGNVFGSSPFLGLVAVGGLIFLTFFAALINVWLAVLISKIKNLPPKLITANSLAMILMIIIAWQISNFRLNENARDYNNLKNSLSVAFVSVNEKFNFSQADELKKDLASTRTDLIIFPEDTFSDFGGARSLDFYKNLSKELKTNLLATFDTEQNGKRYNSTILFNGNGEVTGVYNKNHLTFMGEYWPFGNWHPSFYDWLRKNNPEFENYAIFNPQNAYAQGKKKILSINRNRSIINFASLICLEIHYPSDLKEYAKNGAQFIINPTSNRWLSLGTEHFLYLSNNLRKIEAVWLKIPIISSGVKDFAGVITPDGKINFVNYEDKDKNYGLLIDKIKY